MVTCAPIACKHKVSGSISLPSRGSFHLSLTVLYAIGHWVVFRLGGWSLPLQTGFHVSGPTLVPPACLLLRVQDCYLLRLNFPDLFRSHNLNRVVVVRNPELQAVRFGLFPFRSPLLRKSMFLSLPTGT